MSTDAWTRFEQEAREAFHGPGRFPVRAYSEFMPSPFVGIKPYRPDRNGKSATNGARPHALDIDEYEQAFDLDPGLDRIADRIFHELGKLVRGEAHQLSSTLLEGNAAWPPELANAAREGRLADEPLVIASALALSRTQDDKGNDRWTLFGTSHDGPSAPLWHRVDEARLAELVRFAGVKGSWKVVAGDLPAALQHLRLAGPVAGLEAVVTFEPFARLPAEIRAAYLARTLRLVPTPASLIWFEHAHYRRLAAQLPRATQIPLLHLFPRVERSCAIRIPQSGWLDEADAAQAQGHKLVTHLARTHRWQRVTRDQRVPGTSGGANEPAHGDGVARAGSRAPAPGDGPGPGLAT